MRRDTHIAHLIDVVRCRPLVHADRQICRAICCIDTRAIRLLIKNNLIAFTVLELLEPSR